MPDLHQLNHAIIEFYEKLSSWEHSVVKEIGVSLSQVHTIELLGIHGAMRMKELAEKMAITTGTLTVQVDKMVAAELVRRRPHESDRRSILVELTPKGEVMYQQHDALHHQLTVDLCANLDGDEQRLLLRCLSKMNHEF
ncbi:MarR family transcriptional regulator [uncultured Ferrimonas sp.]|uniref:MarR family winged helix-turn-helix transcriptional regulator n=1 Tax=uncultured Ferrimonas sp. TaxID=432640 RepID=UPI00262ECFFA|nr:MarR family transcriptional regulator [uncultured Ferrimonas sp.]